MVNSGVVNVSVTVGRWDDSSRLRNFPARLVPARISAVVAHDVREEGRRKGEKGKGRKKEGRLTTVPVFLRVLDGGYHQLVE
jgi:hypothetical protein